MTVSNHSLNKKFVSQEKIDFSTTIAAVNDNFHSTAINYTITGFNEMESINITHQKYLGVLGDHLVASFGFNHILSTNRRTPGKLGLDALYKTKVLMVSFLSISRTFIPTYIPEQPMLVSS